MKALSEARVWFTGLELRERAMLLLGAALLLFSILYIAAIEPFANAKQALAERVLRKQETAAWMREAAVEVQSLQGALPKAQANTTSLLTTVDSTAKAAGLGAAVRNLQQDDNGAAVRVRLEGATFDDMVSWLNALQRQFGVTATQLTVDRGDTAGTINASLSLERPVS